MKVCDFMTKKVFTLEKSKKIFIAKEIMEWAHIRHVPIVDSERKLVGIISHHDILKVSVASIETRIAKAEKNQHLWSIVVEDVMSPANYTINPEAHISEAAKLMRTHKIGCLPVVEDEFLVGIITAHDLLQVVENAANIDLTN